MGSQSQEGGTIRASRQERRLWFAAGGWVLLIYSTLYFARGPIDFLRERNLLRLTVAAVFLLAAATVVFVLCRQRPGWRGIGVLAVSGLVYLPLLLHVELPEEKLHLIEYGVLGCLIYEALLEGRKRRAEAGDRRPVGLAWPAVGAVLLTAALGWGDEGLQAILPNRFYDLRDVALNAEAAALAVAAMAAWKLSQRRSGQAAAP